MVEICLCLTNTQNLYLSLISICIEKKLIYKLLKRYNHSFLSIKINYTSPSSDSTNAHAISRVLFE